MRWLTFILLTGTGKLIVGKQALIKAVGFALTRYPARCGGGSSSSSPALPFSSLPDVNECEAGNGGCESQCCNTVGSFYCKCAAGLRLERDGKACAGRAGGAAAAWHSRAPAARGRAGHPCGNRGPVVTALPKERLSGFPSPPAYRARFWCCFTVRGKGSLSAARLEVQMVAVKPDLDRSRVFRVRPWPS